MADKWILSQLQVTTKWSPATDLYEDFYEVPLPAVKTVGAVEVSPKATSILTETLVASIVLCNRSAASQNFFIRLVASDSTVTQLHRLSTMLIGGTEVISSGLVLTPGDKITVAVFSFGAVKTDFTLFGVETTLRSGPN